MKPYCYRNRYKYHPVRSKPFADSLYTLAHFSTEDIQHARRATNRRDIHNWLFVLALVLIAFVWSLFRQPPTPKFSYINTRAYHAAHK